MNTNRPQLIKDIVANGKSLIKDRVADLTEIVSTGGGSISVDTSMSDTSTHAVQNKVIKAYVDSNKVTKTSQLTNDSNYITTSTADTNYATKSHTHTKSQITDFPTKVSAFTNDSGYLTQHQSLTDYAKTTDVDNKLSKKANITDLDSYAKTTYVDNSIAKKQDKITSTTSSDTAITLQPNTNVDIITTASATTITVAIPTDTSIVNEYDCTINTTTGTDVTIALADTTKTIVWDNNPTFE